MRLARAALVMALSCAVATALAEGAGEARADERLDAPAIAIVCVAGDRFGLRLAAELGELGFRVILIDPPDEAASRLSLESAARRAGAVAAIRAVPSERGVEVWIADRVTGKTLQREIHSAGWDDETALALRAVELLRASLLEVALPEAPAGEAPATAELTERLTLPARASFAPVTPAPRVLRASLAPGLTLSPGGFDAAPSLYVGLDWMGSDHVGFAALAGFPLASARAEGPDGAASLLVVTAGGALRFVPSAPASAWSPSVDVGALAFWLRVDGAAGAGSSRSSSAASTAAPFARVGLAYALTPIVRLRADLLASVVAQGVTLRLAGRETANWGEPLIVPSVGADVGLF